MRAEIRTIPGVIAATAVLVLPGCDPGAPGGEPAECQVGELSAYLDPGFDRQLAQNPFSGSATIAAHDQRDSGHSLLLTLESGEDVSLFYRLGAEVLPVTVGQDVHAFIDLAMPFWTEATLVLREPATPSSSPGPLIAAVWSTSGDLPPAAELADLTIRYVDAGCGVLHGDCGDRVPLSLEVQRSEDVSPIRVDAGTALIDAGLRMGNGSASTRLVGTIQCTDTPQSWTAGYLLALP